MSEYNASITQDECCGESLNDDDNDDAFDDLNNIDDSEVRALFFSGLKSIYCFFLLLLIVGRSSVYQCWYLCTMEKN
jgi:hypothetical protein